MEIDPRSRGGYGIAEDTAQIMSPQMFREFCAPYANRLFETFGKGFADRRGVHMCGQSAHLHKVLVEDMKISSFNIPRRLSVECPIFRYAMLLHVVLLAEQIAFHPSVR